MNYFAPRWVTAVRADQREERPKERLELAQLRGQPAWVLLGEPGAGKSEALKREAQQSGGSYLPIADFLAEDFDEHSPAPLFLDGLDEIRAGGAAGDVARQVRIKLNKLDKPSFRLACRAADWLGASDRSILDGATRDGTLRVYRLEPLDEQDIQTLLRESHGKPDPAAFMTTAHKKGIAGLLDNPQTLGLLAKAIEGENWPASRQAVFELACEKLAQEDNHSHRSATTTRPRSNAELLYAAGQLCAGLLLADKSGIALDQDVATGRFPDLPDFAPPDPELARLVTGRKLFRPADAAEQRIEPCHRSVAEFLAARWLGQRIDAHGLPLGRVLNLLAGRDGRTVAGLRGLYAWLALWCHSARPRLIAADPLTVLLYGDPQPMDRENKRALLKGLRLEAAQHSGFIWELRDAPTLAALADPALKEDFRAALTTPERDSASQSYAACVLQVLTEGAPIPALTALLRQVVGEADRWGVVRTRALDAWLQQAVPTAEKIALLDDITAGKVTDSDDELAGSLLRHLVPSHLPPSEWLKYLHAPKQKNLTGAYIWFWQQEMPQMLDHEALSLILDQLTQTNLPFSDFDQFGLRWMLGSLLQRGVIEHGEVVPADQLLAWLGIGADEYGFVVGEARDQEAIGKWLKNHTDRLKQMLLLCADRCRHEETPLRCLVSLRHRFRNAYFATNMGTWYLEQAGSESNDELAQYFLSEAVSTLTRPNGDQVLRLEDIESWAKAHPQRAPWLEKLLAWEIQPYHVEEANRRKAQEQQQHGRKRARAKRLAPNMGALQDGSASPALFNELADVWMGYHPDAHGNTPQERFSHYCDNPEETLAAAEQGFRLCPLRPNLPSVEEIITLHIENRFHYIRLPCLVGMELRWQDGATEVDALSDDILGRMLAFRLSFEVDKTPAWFLYCVTDKPTLVAKVLVPFVAECLKKKPEAVSGIYPLYGEPAYAAVARLALPELLRQLPPRIGSGGLSTVEYLLKAALKHVPECLPDLIEAQTISENMDVGQKVYWLACGLLLDPARYETRLWQFVASSRDAVQHLANFLSGNQIASHEGSYALSPSSIGKLIELLLPHAELEYPEGACNVTPALQNGDQIRALINQLATQASDTALEELERLLALPSLHKLKFQLENARHELRLKQRENEFAFPELPAVAAILANREPANIGDLTALVLDHLDDIAANIRGASHDLFRLFWTEDKENIPKPENSCRDTLLTLLEARLSAFGLDCTAEANQFNDKRADLRIAYRNQFALPIEIKRDSNDSLWTALHKQLQAQYSRAPEAGDFGIYLVLWFGGDKMPRVTDGGKKPRSPEELRTRLEAQLDPMERKRLFVQILDVSWPEK